MCNTEEGLAGLVMNGWDHCCNQPLHVRMHACMCVFVYVCVCICAHYAMHESRQQLSSYLLLNTLYTAPRE